jgi:NitT/TauT family transport system substrate-binding protein
MIDTLKCKRVDAVFAVDPFYTVAKGDPTLESIGSPYPSVQPHLAVAQYVATEAFIAANPDTIKRFNAALQAGIEWVSKELNSKQAHELLSSYTKIKPAQLAKMAPMADPPRRVDAGSIAKTIAFMKTHGLLTSEVSVDALLAPSAQ